MLEAEAYEGLMSATLDIEYERFEQALQSLMKARIIYKNLVASKDSLEAAIYNEKIEEIDANLDPLLRLCSSKSNTGSGQKTRDQMESEISESTGLDTRIKESITSAKRENLENLESITHQGKTIPLKTQRLKHVFKKLELQSDIIEHLDDSDNLEKVKAHSEMIWIVEDCLVIINKEKAEETKKSEASGTLYNLLISYVMKMKLTSILERCLLKAFSFAETIPLSVCFGR